MGLREKKALRTRETILDAALSLFEEQGFENTTMEQIAAASDIGIATLYRYFPYKDAVLLDGVASTLGSFADRLNAQPEDLPLDEALGQALHDLLVDTEQFAERTLRLRAQLDRAPGPRARLWDLWAQERTLLEEAIARRAGAEADELWVGLAAHTAMMVAEISLDLRRSTLADRDAADYADEVIRMLSAEGAIIPRLPSSAAGRGHRRG